MNDPHAAAKTLAPETPLLGITLEVDATPARANGANRRLARKASTTLACIAACSAIAASGTSRSVAPTGRAPRQLITNAAVDAGVEAGLDAEAPAATSPTPAADHASAPQRPAPRVDERRPRGRVGDLSWASTSGPPLKVPIPAAQLAGFRRDAELAQLARHIRNACRSAVAKQMSERKSVHATAHLEIAATGAVSVTGVSGDAPLVSACVARAASSRPLRPGRAETRELPFSWVTQ